MNAAARIATGEWDLFLDESGTFEAPQSAGGNGKRPFPAQIAGFLTPHGGLSEADAEALLAAAFYRAKQPCPEEVHGVELFHGRRAWSHLASWPERKAAYAAVINALVGAFRAAAIQPVRLVNRERIPHRDRIEAQVAMTAALAGRLALRMARGGESKVRLFLHLAQVTAPGRTGTVRIGRQAYETALQTELALLLAKHDLPADRWEVAVVSIDPAAASRRLQISDLISHASHDNFSPCAGTTAARNLQDALRPFDISLALPLAIEQAEYSLAEGDVATALQLLAHRHIGRPPAARGGRSAADLEERSVAALAMMSDNARNEHLEQLLIWVRRIVSERWRSDLTAAACNWLIARVEAPLVERLPAAYELAWFRLSLRAWLLTVYNQNGRLKEGQHVVGQMTALLPEIAGRWEHAATLLGALVTIAVHEIDCREFDRAVKRAEAVARFYEELSDLFSLAMPEVFAERARSNVRGKALGTALQARLHRGPRNADDIATARQLSDAALAEFDSTADRSRQHQYRAFLETLAGNYPGARQHLGCSLDVAGGHEAIGAAIASLPPLQQGFPLLHWLRLGAAAQRAGEATEAQAFRSALDGLGLRRSLWCLGRTDSFPVHAVLLHIAAHDAAFGDHSRSLATLRKLAALNVEERPAIGIIVAAAFALAAGLLWKPHRQQAWQILRGGQAGRPALDRLISPIREAARPFPAIVGWFDALDAELREIRAGNVDADRVSDRLLSVADGVVI